MTSSDTGAPTVIVQLRPRTPPADEFALTAEAARGSGQKFLVPGKRVDPNKARSARYDGESSRAHVARSFAI